MTNHLAHLCGILLLLLAPTHLLAQPSPAAVAAFNTYADAVESRLDHQHRSPTFFLLLGDPAQQSAQRLRTGAILIDQISTPNPPASILHHWRATAFAPHTTAAEFENLLRNINEYPKIYAPQVLQAAILTQTPNHTTASMRVRQHHILTVTMDTTYDITFNHLDLKHGFSTSRSTHITELDSTNQPTSNHGFLWRQNTYWTWEECDGGLYLQIESISLSRAIPTGLAWAVRPFVESVPRESLEFTLRSTLTALRK